MNTRRPWLRPDIKIVPMWSWPWLRATASGAVVYGAAAGTFVWVSAGHGPAAGAVAALAVTAAVSFLSGFTRQLWRQRAGLVQLWQIRPTRRR